MNGDKVYSNQRVDSKLIRLIAVILLSIFWTGERAFAEDDVRARISVATRSVPSARKKQEALRTLTEILGTYSKDRLDATKFDGLLSGVAGVEGRYGITAGGFKGLIDQPVEMPHPGSEEVRLDYSKTEESLKNVQSVANEVQVSLIPEISREVAAEKENDRNGYPYGEMPMGGGGGGSGASGKSGGGGSGSPNSGGMSLGDRGGNPLDMVRPPEESPISQAQSSQTASSLTPFESPESTRPKIALKNASDPMQPPNRSGSPLLNGIQKLVGDKSIPDLLSPPGGGFAANGAGGDDEKNLGLKTGSQPKGEGLGEPSVSEVGGGGDFRNNFSAKAPDQAAVVEGVEEGVGASGSTSDSKEDSGNRAQVLALGPADEKGRSWIFSYSPKKFINKSCEHIERSPIGSFCFVAKRKLAEATTAQAAH